MANMISGILDNNHIPNTVEVAILEQARLICRRVIAFQEWGSRSPQVNKINTDLARHVEVLHRNGFEVKKDIFPLNLWITRRVFRQQYGIEKLLARINKKIPPENKKEKESKS